MKKEATTSLTQGAARTLRAADVVLSLDWYDLNGTLQQAWRNEDVDAKVIQISLDYYSHRGWSMDHQGLPPVDVFMPVEPDVAVPLLCTACASRPARNEAVTVTVTRSPSPEDGTISIAMVADALRRAAGSQPVTLIRVPLGWSGEMGHFRDPLDWSVATRDEQCVASAAQGLLRCAVHPDIARHGAHCAGRGTHRSG